MDSLPHTLKLDVDFMAMTLAASKREIPFWSTMVEMFIRNQLSFETQKAYLIDLKQFFNWAQKKRVTDFKKISFKLAIEYRDFLKSFSGRVIDGTPTKASNATVHRKICALSSFFEFVAKEVLERTNQSMVNPFKRVDRFKVDNSVTVTEALIKDELARLMNYLDLLSPTLINLRDRAIIKTLFSVIIRNKAFINIKGKDFYIVGERYRLKYTDKGDTLFDESLHPHTASAIIDYLAAMKHEGREVLDDDPLFWPVHNRSDKLASKEEKRRGANTRKHLSVNQITNILRRHCQRAQIGEWVTSHSAKATVTSEIVERYGIHMAQRKTKHKKTDQVAAYYGKRREREVSVFDDLDYITGNDNMGFSRPTLQKC